MTDIPTWRTRAGLTNGRLAVLAAVLTVVLGAVVVYLMNRPDPRPAAEPVPSASAQVATPPLSASAAPGASGRPAGSAATSRPAATATRSPQPPDSVVKPNAAFVDPAAAGGAPAWAAGVPPTCAQWRAAMSDDQRMSYSTALLRAAWQSAGSSATPPASTASSYRSAITDACAGHDEANGNVADMARVVYASDPGTWGP